MDKTRCPHCGEHIRAGSYFCAQGCGRQIDMLRAILIACLLLLSLTGCATHEVALVAKRQVGTHYAAGLKFQCGNFVGHCVSKAGKQTPRNPAKATNWLQWGTPVPWALKQPGDVIVTWRGSKSSGDGHVLIYVGNGKAVHRSTYKAPVGYVDVDSYKSRLLGVRRG